MNVSLEIVKYCAEEVQRQRDRADAVLWMVEAWLLAQQHHAAALRVTPKLIALWGVAVHPSANGGGFRAGRVRVGLQICPDPVVVPRMMDKLCEGISQGLAADEAYYEFQTIHPFCDGNGRTGKILYNYIKNTLDHPVMPPNFFGCANP